MGYDLMFFLMKITLRESYRISSYGIWSCESKNLCRKFSIGSKFYTIHTKILHRIKELEVSFRWQSVGCALVGLFDELSSNKAWAWWARRSIWPKWYGVSFSPGLWQVGPCGQETLIELWLLSDLFSNNTKSMDGLSRDFTYEMTWRSG
jgi:hypothetical protein